MVEHKITKPVEEEKVINKVMCSACGKEVPEDQAWNIKTMFDISNYCMDCNLTSKISIQDDYKKKLSECREYLRNKQYHREVFKIASVIKIPILKDLAQKGLIFHHKDGYFSLTPIGKDLIDEMEEMSKLP